jgi:phage/plasmid-like protein (TIGR03299 family)
MAHMIDTSNGRANMAYVGQEPWHGLGQSLTSDADIDTWTREAGLGFSVKKARPLFLTTLDDGQVESKEMPNKNILYRSDTGLDLGIVSDRYKIVQPADIMKFFKEITENAGFHMETAGSLSEGRRIWGLARAGESAKIRGNDEVKPYVLLATSFDGSLMTVGKFTSVRVVCHNTITVALQGDAQHTVKMSHKSEFNPQRLRDNLGIIVNSWQTWLDSANNMAETKLDANKADEFLIQLVRDSEKDDSDAVRKSKEYRRIMDLFQGAAIGADLAGPDTQWAMLNAVTEYVDHSRVANADRRLNQAWFGEFDKFKTKAFDLLSA